MQEILNGTRLGKFMLLSKGTLFLVAPDFPEIFYVAYLT